MIWKGRYVTLRAGARGGEARGVFVLMVWKAQEAMLGASASMASHLAGLPLRAPHQ